MPLGIEDALQARRVSFFRRSRRPEWRGPGKALRRRLRQGELWIVVDGTTLVRPFRVLSHRAAGFERAAEMPDFYRPGDGKTIFVRRWKETRQEH